MKQKGLILFFILCLILTLPVIGLAEDEEPAKIPDVALKDELRGMLNKGVFEDVYPSELAEFSGAIDFSGLGISDLRGLEYFVNVTSFNFSDNEITTLPSKIAQMDNLEELNLSLNNMFVLPSNIADAPNLKVLNLSGNKLSALPVRIQEMANLEELDISGNRFELLSHRLVYLHLKSFNCNYNFLDFSEGTDNKRDIDAMEVSKNKLYKDQLVKLPAISYITDNGDFKVKWRAADDLEFKDGTTAEITGYTILMDEEFIKTVEPEETEYSFGWMEGGTYLLSVSPDYSVDGYQDFPIRSYTSISAVYGQDGPYLPDGEESGDESEAGDNESVQAPDEKDETEAEPFKTVWTDDEGNQSEGLSLLTVILIGAVVLLAAGLATMIIIFLKKDKS